MLGTGSHGVAQIPIYISGVGTGQGPTVISRTIDSWLGGGFGWGLLANIEEAYRHIVFLYEPGDEIIILGFSRGAYTARSLTGFIRSTGIIGRDALHRIPDAIKRYRTLNDPTTHPSTDESHEFRANVSPKIATSEEELAWRSSRGMPAAHLLRIAYLGVWDSVGALGVPKHIPLLGRWTARRYRFHDANLSSMVRSARHAVALDERRRTFMPTRWDNVGELNAAHGTSEERPYQELFFPGDHGSIGGGGDITELSSIGLRWIIEGAAAAGLSFDDKMLQSIQAEENPMGPLRNTSKEPSGILNWFMHRNPVDRTGPSSLDELHKSAFLRWSAEAKASSFKPYRPGNLKQLETELARLHDQEVLGEKQDSRLA